MAPLCSLPYRAEAFASQSAMPPSSSLDPEAPLPSLCVDSEYCVNPLSGQVLPAAQTESKALSAQNGLSGGGGGVSLAPAAPDGEPLPSALAAARPLLYVPPAPLLMLCGGLQEGPPAPGAGSEGAAAEQPPAPSGQKRLSRDWKPQQEDEAPATKRQSRDHGAGPLALVMPKVSARRPCRLKAPRPGVFLTGTRR